MGPSAAPIVALKLLPGTVSYYHLIVQLPGDFYGQSTVSFVVSWFFRKGQLWMGWPVIQMLDWI